MAATELLAMKPTATLNDIAQHANIGIATLHRYFKTRHQLMIDIATKTINELDEQLIQFPIHDITTQEDLEDFFSRLIPLGSNIFFLKVLFFDEDIPGINQDSNSALVHLSELVQRLIDIHLFGTELPFDWMVSAIYDLIYSIWREVALGNLGKNQAPKILTQTVVNAFSSRQ